MSKLVITSSGLPQAVATRSLIMNQVRRSLDTEKLLAFFERHPQLLIPSLQCAYPLDEGLLRQLDDKIDWDVVSANRQIRWDAKLLSKFASELHWPTVSANPSLPLDEALIEQFGHRWDWQALSNNPSLHVSTPFLRHFRQNWHWPSLSRNETLGWQAAWLSEFCDELDWSQLSINPALPWSRQLLTQFGMRLNWSMLSANAGLPLDIALLDDYASRWSWAELSHNPSLPWSTMFLQQHLSLVDWHALSLNTGLPWSLTLLEQYQTRWNWSLLSRNPALPWDLAMLERYASRWDWTGLCSNPGIAWSDDWLERYRHRLDPTALSQNPSICWDDLRLQRYSELVNLQHIPLESISWGLPLIEKFAQVISARLAKAKFFHTDLFGVSNLNRQQLSLYLHRIAEKQAQDQFRAALNYFFAEAFEEMSPPWPEIQIRPTREQCAADPEQIAFWYEQQAEAGDMEAAFVVSMLYSLGAFVDPDDERAFFWCQLSASEGNANAQFNLGFMYEYGRGVVQDDAHAISWYGKAAEQGHIVAQCNLANLNYEEEQVKSSSALVDAGPQEIAIQAEGHLINGRYQDHIDGTVTDIETGLMWMRPCVGQRWHQGQVVGEACELDWDDAMQLTGGGFAGYDDWRLPTREELNSLVYSSTRLRKPFDDEGVGGACEGEYQTPTIDLDAFPNTPEEGFWSSSRNANDPALIWGVDFQFGVVDSWSIDSYGAGCGGQVRFVRGSSLANLSCGKEQVKSSNVLVDAGPQEIPIQAEGHLINGRYQDHADGTVTDIETNLMWMRPCVGQRWYRGQVVGEADKMNWHDALDQTGDGFAGYDDWRLPTCEELNSLVYCSTGLREPINDIGGGSQFIGEYQKPTTDLDDLFFWLVKPINDIGRGGQCIGEYQAPTIDLDAFPNTPKYWFWSSSPYAYTSGTAFYVGFDGGYVHYFNKLYRNRVRLVRAGQ